MLLNLALAGAVAAGPAIDAYLRPYVSSGNFSGSILVAQSGKTLFEHSYGVSRDAKFHLASLSMQFTAAAALRLAEEGKLSLDTKVSELVSGVPNGEKITVRNLLQENSGLPDANDLPDFDDLLKAHQTPETLVQFIRNRPIRHEPGGPSRDEEHSAYNLLALIIERKTGLPFKGAVKREVFAPLGMTQCGSDDDSPIEGSVAPGQVEDGPVKLKPAPAIHWSAKTGNASIYCTVSDEHRWLNGFFRKSFLSDAHKKEILDWGNGYGWSTAKKFSGYYMNGQSPGFASMIIYLPKLDAEIIILCNSQIPVATPIGIDLAAMLEGREYQPLEISAAPVKPLVGRFTFGADFYRENATLELVDTSDRGLILRWPGGPDSPVIVVDDRHFIDRHYWTRFSIDDSGMTFGNFKGHR